jgi:glycosyltransferase involved in cell wall biosynthesis
MEVGVVVPVRAPAPFLAATLHSLLSQVPAPQRIVVVDDGSSPPLPEDPRVAWIRRDSPAGPGAARNAGIEALRTDWIAFCDADDEWLAGKLAAQLRALGEHPPATVCVGSAEIVDAGGRPTGERWPAFRGPQELYESNPILLSSVLVRRDVLVGAGGFDAGLTHAEDWELWLRLAGRGAGFLGVPEARVRYRRHRGGLTADVTALARAQLEVHRRHGRSVPSQVRRRVEHRDLLALAEGLLRERRWDDARAALDEAAALGAVPWRQRARLLPGLRHVAGRRDPYRRRA